MTTAGLKMSNNVRRIRNNICALKMRRSAVLLALLAIAAGYTVSRGAGAESAQVAHGKYLVQLAGCTDCHTPGHLLGKPDMSRFLAGSDVVWASRRPAWVSLPVRTSRPTTTQDSAIGPRMKSRRPSKRESDPMGVSLRP